MSSFPILALLAIASISCVKNSVNTRDLSTKLPEQINVSIAESSKKMNVTFTSISTSMLGGSVDVWEKGSSNVTSFEAESFRRSVSNSGFRDDNGDRIKEKMFYNVKLDKLSPNTHYEYRCYTKDQYGTYKSEVHDFYTPRSENDEGKLSFIYIADPQANTTDGRAISTTTELSKTLFPDAEFLYIGGDLINGGWPNYDEEQWETFFNQPGTTYENANFNNQISNYTIAATQGNHDEETFNGHIRHPSAMLFNNSGSEYTEHKLTYSFSWGMLRMIVLNTEWRGTTEYEQQKNFVRKEVTDAKSKGQYTVVAFHRSMYTGGSHISSDDSIVRRKQFASFFQEVGVDMVFQGHDHVLARAKVDGNGNNASVNQKIDDRIYIDDLNSNSPLYYVGGTASTFKAYGVTSYTVSSGDPLLPNYSFLDFNSASQQGSDLNPLGPSSYEGKVSPSFTNVTVSKDEISFDTYCYGYDGLNDVITSEPMLMDSYTMCINRSEKTEEYKNITSSSDSEKLTVKVAKKAIPSSQVLLTAQGTDEIALKEFEVKSNGDVVSLQKNRFGYTFTMPNGDVTIEATSRRSPKLDYEDDLINICSSSDSFNVKSVTSISDDDLSNSLDTFVSQNAPLSASSSDEMLLLAKKVINIDSNIDLSSLRGIEMNHTTNGGYILYVNGIEVYRYNVGKFGKVVTSSDIFDGLYADGYESSAIERKTTLFEDGHDALTGYLSNEEYPLLEGSSLTNLSNVLRHGENTFVFAALKTNETSELTFSMSASLHFDSDLLKQAWRNANNKLDQLYSLASSEYSISESTILKNAIVSARKKLNSKKYRSEESIESILEEVNSIFRKMKTIVEETEEAISAIPSNPTKADSEFIEKALSLYDSLTEEQKARVSNRSILETARVIYNGFVKEITIIEMPNKLTYVKGETIDLSGLIVKAIKNDGSEEILNATSLVINDVSSEKCGTKVVVIEYNGCYTSFQIEVVEYLPSTKTNGFNPLYLIPIIIGGIAIISIPVVVVSKKKKIKR